MITEVRDEHGDENDEGCDDKEAFHEPDEQTDDETYTGHCRCPSARREECPEYGCPGDHPRAVVGDRCGGMHLHRAEQADGQDGTELEQAQVREPSHPNQQASGHDAPDEPSPSGGDERRLGRVIRLSGEEIGEVTEGGLSDGLVAVSSRPGTKPDCAP